MLTRIIPEAEELRNILLQLPESLTDEEMDEMLRAGDKVGFIETSNGYLNLIDQIYLEPMFNSILLLEWGWKI